eukprot:gnl/TRDRNA2_/TRDRNA2_136810_c0_seq1.p1 gnl/TRDRNA2_/TRDRNA2_136810_c0~~gnl/TRDRNA2_/TRDRNA2_136810_c0_seq1.p1  ORF type:complete len:244 (+),score=13.09 gnl/TRDRNA2_/TRDRNA2_136810_c0_seq1:120-851(+)
MLNAVFLVALALTTLAQARGAAITPLLNTIESFVMSVCKFAVSLSAIAVHRNLAPVSRIVVGPWILWIAVSKMLMAGGELMLTVGYLGVAADSTCAAFRLFCLSLMFSVIFQSTAGFALFRIYRRVANHLGETDVFSRVLGCWWAALVCSNFGVGIGLWACGRELLYNGLGEKRINLMPLLFAACCQITEGFSMLRTNQRLRAYFASPEGKVTLAELSEEVAMLSRPRGTGEVRERVAHASVE